jgi:hypothetical protein
MITCTCSNIHSCGLNKLNIHTSLKWSCSTQRRQTQYWIQTELIQELQEVTAAKLHKQLFTKPPGPGPLDWKWI